MRKESPENRRPLRSGYSTGACATAAALGAGHALLTGECQEAVTIRLPRGQDVLFSLDRCHLCGGHAEAGIVKDAGDDPDCTHGATVFARVSLGDTPGVRFHAAEGVGTVTRQGLEIPLGEPAINPVPRKMIAEHLEQLAGRLGYLGGFDVAIGVEGGAELALKTMNPRLGIVGGLSILGTTGIVRPFSCAAYIASIHQGIDVARANGIAHIAASTGSTSEAAIRAHYGLPDMALVEMGDFVGAVLKHVRKFPVQRLSLCGGFAKISKLALGQMDLHSRKSGVDFDHLAAEARALGGAVATACAIRGANTSAEALSAAMRAGLPLGDRVCRRARSVAKAVVAGDVDVEVWAIDRRGEFVGHAAFSCDES